MALSPTVILARHGAPPSARGISRSHAKSPFHESTCVTSSAVTHDELERRRCAEWRWRTVGRCSSSGASMSSLETSRRPHDEIGSSRTCRRFSRRTRVLRGSEESLREVLTPRHTAFVVRCALAGLVLARRPQASQPRGSSAIRSTRRRSSLSRSTDRRVQVARCSAALRSALRRTYSPMSSFQSSGFSSMNFRMSSMSSGALTISSSTPRLERCASGPRKFWFSPMTMRGIS